MASRARDNVDVDDLTIRATDIQYAQRVTEVPETQEAEPVPEVSSSNTEAPTVQQQIVAAEARLQEIQDLQRLRDLQAQIAAEEIAQRDSDGDVPMRPSRKKGKKAKRSRHAARGDVTDPSDSFVRDSFMSFAPDGALAGLVLHS